MSYLIGLDSFLLKIAEEYKRKIKGDTSHFYQMEFGNHIYISYAQCIELFNLTYLSEAQPLGKYDTNNLVGKIIINEHEVSSFNSNIKSSLERIFKNQELHSISSAIVRCFIPVGETDCIKQRENGNGSSVHWFKGAIFLSLPKKSEFSHLELDLNIVHELGHQSLMLYQDSDPIIHNGLATLVYSSVRKTRRPSIMSFHALVAVYYMLSLLKSKSTNQYWLSLSTQDQQYLLKRENELRVQFVSGAEALKFSEWTPLGMHLYREMIKFYLIEYSKNSRNSHDA